MSDYVLIERGALKLVENVLRRAGKDEVADAMLAGTAPVDEYVEAPRSEKLDVVM